MTIDSSLRSVIDSFALSGEPVEVEEIKTGHINRTYRVRCREASGAARDYVLQRINSFAFKKPAEVMENVQLVTEHLSDAMRAKGIDPRGRVLQLIPARAGGVSHIDGEGQYWRAYDYISNAVTLNRVESPAQFREIGRAFGEFQNMLSDFPIHRLHETIPDFHDTRKRLAAFEASVARDCASRAASVLPEIAFVRRRKSEMCRIVDLIEAGVLPLRVTHNDTKINNVMLDEDSGRALCVIDLDTVMAGSTLYDYGDALRFGASTAAEDERDLARVALDIDLFRGFSEGFISQTVDGLAPAELENLPLGALVMTFEVGMRFLADYLDGDLYFRIEYPDHNLVRARCQFRLLSDMEAHRAEMDAIVRELAEAYRQAPAG